MAINFGEIYPNQFLQKIRLKGDLDRIINWRKKKPKALEISTTLSLRFNDDVI